MKKYVILNQYLNSRDNYNYLFQCLNKMFDIQLYTKFGVH